MVESLPTPAVLRRYVDGGFGPLVPAFELRWGESPGRGRERIWELPEGLNVVGPPPRHFGVRIERLGPDAYSVRLLWDRTRLGWDSLCRAQLLTCAVRPLMSLLGLELRTALDQPVRGRTAAGMRTAA